MSITVACSACGKTLKAPDSAAGKRAKCPQCSATVEVPEPIYDADEFAVTAGDASGADEFAGDDFGDITEFDDIDEYAGPAITDAVDRRPCPMCGEEIAVQAIKCRFCGEVFDRTKPGSGRIDADLVKRFRREVHGLGGFWVFISVACAIVVIVLIVRGVGGGAAIQGPALGVIVALVFLWGVIGVGTCMKKMWALYTGLAVSYVSLIGNLIALNLCGIAVLALVIVQAHRALGWAKKMEAAGIPLTTKV